MLKKFLAVFLCFALLMASGVVTNYNAFEKVSAAGIFTTATSNAVSITENGIKHDAELKVWDGKAGTTAPETTVIDGETFYMIEEGADLAWFANKVNTGNSSDDSSNRESNAILVNDIDLGGHNWYNFRIGQSWYFAGTFDGAGHTIHNLYIESSTGGGGFIGAMGITGKAATIKNVKLIKTKILTFLNGK